MSWMQASTCRFSRLWPHAAILILGLLFFSPLLLHPTHILYSDYSDFLSYNIPGKFFLAQSFQQTGEIPLWNPHLFGGLPFVHDAQMGIFYPLHWPLLWLPPEGCGAFLSWLVVVHIVLAGWSMYGYARASGVGRLPAVVAGCGYMFAGKWLMHLLIGGHYVLVGLAWLPLVLLLLERAIVRRDAFAAVGAGISFALIVLSTHPQVTLYAGVFVTIWLLALVAEDRANRRERLLRWSGYGFLAAGVAICLSFIQILPAVEAARLSSRSVGPPWSVSEIFGGFQRNLTGLIGPPWTDAMPGWLWEDRLAAGFLWLVLAIAAPLSIADRRLRFQAYVSVGVLAFGLGGGILANWLPGFSLFRLPSRMLLFLAFPVSLFTSRLFQVLADPASSQTRDRVPKVCFAISLILGGLVVLSVLFLKQIGLPLVFAFYWPVLVGSLVLCFWLLPRLHAAPIYPLVLAGLLIADLWLIARPLVTVRSWQHIYAVPDCVIEAKRTAGRFGRISSVPPAADRNGKRPTWATPLWPNLAQVLEVDSIEGYNPLDVLRYKQYLKFMAADAEPVRVGSYLTRPAVIEAPIKNQKLADLLGVRSLLIPKSLPVDEYLAKDSVAWAKVGEDRRAFGSFFMPSHGAGRQALPPYAIYQNTAAWPRAFLVFGAEPLEEANAYEQLLSTDLRRKVLLENWTSHAEMANSATTPFAEAAIEHYSPNRITVRLPGTKQKSWLVLNDVWYPGWTCLVDGKPKTVLRANYLFRAVEVPAGAKEAVFTFSPRSYRLGRTVTLVSICLLALAAGWSGWRQRSSFRQALSIG
ncbi:MAG: hypothetical protein KatS3mg105_4244 [Gemmatales bacterium]|nr:MAG: hypothetical protein KatS3mg105_4244 [Gemmatales bacterium]